MEELSDNKFQIMVDEMHRFEEEIAMPYVPDMDGMMMANALVSRPFVIGTNTFSQAQQKIQQVTDGVPSDAPMFIPPQILHASPANSVQGVIPPPPPPPLSMPPAGMTFPPRLTMPYNQPIPPPPQPPSFPSSLVIRPETVTQPSSIVTAPNVTFPRRTTPAPVQWPPRPGFKPPTPTKTETTTKLDEEPLKVVLSATPKLYTPKIEIPDESHMMIPTINYRVPSSDLSKMSSYDMRFGNKKKNDPPKYTPTTSTTTNTSNITDPFSVKKNEKKKKKCVRVSGGQTWEDPTLVEWEDGDFRLFCGDLGNDVTDELLTRIFSKYPSFLKARVVRDKRTNKTKGFGFISFKDPQDFIKASKEMNGRYVGSRPIKLRKSTWKNRNLDTVKKKEKEKAALVALLTGKS